MLEPQAKPAAPNTSATKAPTSTTPATPQIKKPAPLKAVKDDGEWERNFMGNKAGITFWLRLKRDASGHLHGRYMVKPGRGHGWHLEGQIRQDGTFVLAGTENKTLFHGYVSNDGSLQVYSFVNKSTNFSINNLEMYISKEIYMPEEKSTTSKNSDPLNDNQTQYNRPDTQDDKKSTDKIIPVDKAQPGQPDILDQLMGFSSSRKTYTVEEVRRARSLILKKWQK